MPIPPEPEHPRTPDSGEPMDITTWSALAVGTVVLIFFSMAVSTAAPMLASGSEGQAAMLVGTVAPWVPAAISVALAYALRSPAWLLLGFAGVAALLTVLLW